ncbi:hypothetical protein GCM10023219_05240 [Stakelama sediminis]|uniref:SPOR domain-containing protein n=1 Tax=Stakelama sediminis TaxID=463200 RepID=A0A840YUJ1_9SPHN|nr:SPOR domain-containing protein [Stakelama sediminis]MBB5717240.1 hypothetical protein [Stakelama sediminis]
MKRGVSGILASTVLLIAVAAPALADVKEGIDAWERGDYAKAVAEWRGPAERGDADAEFNLGQAYKLGRGVPADLKTAEQWYRKAALQGHQQASDNYGLALFQNGKRVEALPWLKKSAQRGDPRAQFVLGTMYFNGTVIPKDWVRAYALMSRASAGGLPRASKTLTDMARYVTLSDREQGLALARKYEAATDKNSVDLAGMQVAALPVQVASNAPETKRTPPPSSPAPKPKPVKGPVQQQPKIVDGGWRVQLGAFGEDGNARRLWAKLGSRVAMLKGRQVYYVKAGKLTRLQVGPYASAAEAMRACAEVKRAGNGCLPTRK